MELELLNVLGRRRMEREIARLTEHTIICGAGRVGRTVARELRARGHWVKLRHPEMGDTLYDGIPYRLSKTPGRLQWAAPQLGADTWDVLTDLLGVSNSEYDRLEASGAVG